MSPDNPRQPQNTPNVPNDPPASTPVSSYGTVPNASAPQSVDAMADLNNAAVAPAPTDPITPPKKTKKPLIIAAAVVVALAASATAGALWWSSPQKAFDDVTGAQTSIKGGTLKGSMTLTPSSGTAVKVSYDSKFNGKATNTALEVNADAGMMKFNMTGGLATDTSNNVYFKLNDVRKTMTSFAGENASTFEQYYGSLIDKIDGKWVEVTAAELKEQAKDSGVDTTCAMDKVGGIFEKPSYQKEFSDLYSKNKFMSIKETLASETINGHDSHHYVLAVDKSKSESYQKAIKETQWFKDFKSCYTDQTQADEAFSTSDSAVTTTADPKIELWVDKWTHLPTKFAVTQDQDGTKVMIEGVLTFSDTQAVETPKADTQFKDLQKEIESVQQQFQTSSAGDETTVLGTSVIRGL